MTFKEQALNDLPVFFNGGEFASAALYYAPGDAEGQAVSVVLTNDGKNEVQTGSRSKGMAMFRESELAAPEYQGRIVLTDGTEWKLKKDLGTNEGIHRWEVDRDLRPAMRKG